MEKHEESIESTSDEDEEFGLRGIEKRYVSKYSIC
jgi:hypothetical protein